VSRKYMPPLRVRPEPTTRLGIVEEIAALQQHRPGSPPFMQWWIDRRIKELQEKLEGMK
jgi:hypothetical protein